MVLLLYLRICHFRTLWHILVKNDTFWEIAREPFVAHQIRNQIRIQWKISEKMRYMKTILFHFFQKIRKNVIYVGFWNIVYRIFNFDGSSEFFSPKFPKIVLLKIIKLRGLQNLRILRIKLKFVFKKFEKFTKNSTFWTLKIRQKCNFQLFFIFSFAKWSQYNILSIRTIRINLAHLLVFNIAKTAENAVSAVKSRIVRKLAIWFRFRPQIRNQRPKIY